MSWNSSRSNVDDTLFESKSARARKLRLSGRTVVGQTHAQPIVISRADLQRMKESTVILSDGELRRQREAHRREQEEQMRETKERRERMEKKEIERMKRLPKSKAEQRRLAEQKKYTLRAVQLKEDEKDDVKTMNAMMQYSFTVAIRDAQLKEKKLLQRKAVLEEKRAGLKMEIARIKTVKKYLDRDNATRAQAVKDRGHIEVQIKQRQEKRELEKLAKLEEQRRMKARMAELDAEEAGVQRRKKAEAKILLDDIMQDNRNQIAHRKKLRELDIEEDKRIHKYQEALREKEKRLEAEKVARAHEREMALAKMRAEQQKTADANAALDGLRAKRAAEENERRARSRDLREAAEKQRQIEELTAYRDLQHQAKLIAIAEARAADEAEFMRNEARRKAALHKVQAQQQKDEEARHTHKKDLIKFIRVHEGENAAARKTFIAGGVAAEQEKEEYLAGLNAIKSRKIEALRAQGVPERYLSELNGFDPRKVLLADYKKGI